MKVKQFEYRQIKDAHANIHNIRKHKNATCYRSLVTQIQFDLHLKEFMSVKNYKKCGALLAKE